MSESTEDVGARIRAAMAAGPPGPLTADLEHHDIEGNPIEGPPFSTTTSLADFLLSCLAADEAAARAATAGPWEVVPSYSRAYVQRAEVPATSTTRREPAEPLSWHDDGDLFAIPDAAHIARHDPARVLAEVEVKRKQAAKHGDCGKGYGICDDAGRAWTNDDGSYSCSGLFDLAEVYSWHPDYAANVKSWGG
jgi:hypothetical protein